MPHRVAPAPSWRRVPSPPIVPSGSDYGSVVHLQELRLPRSALLSERLLLDRLDGVMQPIDVRPELRRSGETAPGPAPTPETSAPPPAGRRRHRPMPAIAEATADAAQLDAAMGALGWLRLYPLDPRLMCGLHEMGFAEPRLVQQLALPAALHRRRDLAIGAVTGSGKTLAYGLPVLQQLLESPTGTPDARPRALVLAPSRELATQIRDHLRAAARFAPLRIVAVTGGLSPAKQLRLLAAGPDVLVSTPGRLWDLCTSANFAAVLGASDARAAGSGYWDRLRVLVLDEADSLADYGRFAELRQLLETVYASAAAAAATTAAGPPLQLYLVSATLFVGEAAAPPAERLLARLAPVRPLRGAALERIEVTAGALGGAHVVHAKVLVVNERDDREAALLYCLSRCPGPAVVFFNATTTLRRLARQLAPLIPGLLRFHAAMPQRQRFRALARLNTEPRAVLLATDAAARGLDPPNVALVVHYEPPRSPEIYVHRSGRVARAAGRPGLVVSLVGPADLPALRRHMAALGLPTRLPDVPIAEYEPWRPVAAASRRQAAEADDVRSRAELAALQPPPPGDPEVTFRTFLAALRAQPARDRAEAQLRRVRPAARPGPSLSPAAKRHRRAPVVR